MNEKPQTKTGTPEGKTMTNNPSLSTTILKTLGRGQISGVSARLIICRDEQGNEWLCLKAGINKIALGQLDHQRHAILVPAAQTFLATPEAAWAAKGISDYAEFNATL